MSHFSKAQSKISSEKEIKPIWNANSLSQALGNNIKCDFDAVGVAIDSRTIQPNEIFIAIKGKNFDGNDYAKEALNKGAAVAIVSKLNSELSSNDERIIQVNDTLEALRKLAKYSRARLKGKLIGITGSVGKTSTKEMLKLAFQNQGVVYANEGSFNNHIGLPLSLARMPEDTDYAVIEMGMTHAGEIKDLSQLAIPDIALITNVEEVHLEYFSSVSAIAAAKSEIFDGVKEGGYAIINMDNPYHQILYTKAQDRKLQIIGFSESQKTPARLISYELKNNVGYIQAELFGKDYEYTISAPGKHLALNSIAVLAAVKIAGAEVDYSAASLRDFASVKGRGETHHLKKFTLIDESYNASPVAVKAALHNLGTYKANNENKRLVAVLGTMVELGSNSPQYHKDLFTHIVKNNIDIVFTVGDMMKHLHETLSSPLKGMHTADSAQMAELMKQYIKPGDIVLVKGSRSMKMERIVEALLSLKK
jgi:UDP-N-acetylmuramoyl-tripeptide--D-alanyl-D-alanine ligase